MILNKNKVAVGMSGGVDSTVTAYLLQKKGYEVIGITMYLFDVYDEQGHLVRPAFVDDAIRLSEKLGMAHFVEDFREDFEKHVKEEFVAEYIRGRTPNPCVTCNKHIKYGKLLDAAHKHGAYYLATGHYAQVKYDSAIDRYRVYKGMAKRKDQAFMLHGLKQDQLKCILLPLNEFHSKEEIRKIAEEIDLEISSKLDSDGICFIPEGKYGAYIGKIYPKAIEPGNFVDLEGNVIGQHSGIVNYTVGQKRKLGMVFNRPMTVIKIDPEKNEVVLGPDEATYANGFIGKDANFIPFDDFQGDIQAEVQVCQWGLFLSCKIRQLEGERVQVLFDKPERAIAPGQAAVFYQGDEIIGGTTIDVVTE